jgi:hypothetical protein
LRADDAPALRIAKRRASNQATAHRSATEKDLVALKRKHGLGRDLRPASPRSVAVRDPMKILSDKSDSWRRELLGP